ncbi:MAG TPA: glycosyltransferase [Chitinophagaceae bacterium]|nr:glycosyltransferase [Chitinophagaceae bacterium]
MQIILFIALFLCITYAILFILYQIGWHKTKEVIYNPSHDSSSFSIIIPIRNEEKNIENCLLSILKNNFTKKNYEIIVINDFSDDASVDKIKFLQNSYPQIKLLHLADFISMEERRNSFKKEALQIAITHAKFEWIITTDGDCVVPPNWLKSMQNMIQKHPNIQCIAAPVSFIPFKKENFLYYFQSIDFLSMQGITVASMYLNLGSMANGANFAFKKSAFIAVNGYENINHIASGDDMLLLQKIRKKYPNSIYFLKDKKAIVKTKCQANLHDFFQQRIRWASKSEAYEEKQLQASLLLVYLWNLLGLFLLFLALFQIHYLYLFLLYYTIKIIIELPFVWSVASFFDKRKELFYYPFLQLFHIFYIIIAGFLGLFGSYEWKGRRVK